MVAWSGQTYDSLSKVAFAITGTKWNGCGKSFAATLSIIVALKIGLLIGLLSNCPIRQISCKPTSPLCVVARLVP